MEDQTWSRGFWRKKDRIWKRMLHLINKTEIEGGENLEKRLNAPLLKPGNDWRNWLRRWQYRDQRPIREQQARSFEQLFSGMGWKTLVMAFAVRNFSPNDLRSDDNWQHPKQVQADPIMRSVRQSAPDLPFAVHSPQGLEWFFSVRLGCWCLEADRSKRYDGMITAKFNSTLRYEVKVGIQPIEAQIWFTMDRDRRCLKWHHTLYNSEPIHSATHPLFQDSSRAIMCAALTDVSIKHHGIQHHLLIGDLFTAATYTCLTDPDHPIRRILQSYCFGVWDVSNAARTILLPENGTVNTLFGFSYKGLRRYMNDIFDEYHMSEYHILPNFLKKRGLWQDTNGAHNKHNVSSALPAWSDALLYWQMFEKYVEEVTEAAGYCCDKDVQHDEALQCWAKDIVRQQPHLDACLLQFPMGLTDFRLLLVIFMYHSTVGHELCSMASDLVSSPYVCTTQWRCPETKCASAANAPLEEKISTRDISRRAIVAGHAISLEVKKFNSPWGYLVYTQEEDIWRRCEKSLSVRQVMNTIPARLKQIDDLIVERNRLRKYPHEILRANELNCSLSV